MEQGQCQFCETAKPVVKCRECAVSLCQECSQNIHAKGLFKLHEILPLETIGFTPKKRTHKCFQHDQALTVYCKQCAEVVCSLCVVVGNHKGHDCVSVATQSVDSRNELTTTSTAVKKINAELLESHLTLQMLLEAVRRNAKERRNDLERFEEELILSVKQRFNELRDKVTKTEREKVLYLEF